MFSFINQHTYKNFNYLERRGREMKSNNVLNIMNVAYATIRLSVVDGETNMRLTFYNNYMKEYLQLNRDKILNRNLKRSDHYIDDDWFDYFEMCLRDDQILHFSKYDHTQDKYIEAKIFPINVDANLCGLLIEDQHVAYLYNLEIMKLDRINQIILKNSTYMSFIYSFENRTIKTFQKMMYSRSYDSIHNSVFPDDFIALDLIKEKYVPVVEEALYAIEMGEERSSCFIEIRKSTSENFMWNELLIEVIDYKDDHPLSAVVILKDINNLMQQNETLRLKNSYDALTLAYNREGFRAAIMNRLLLSPTEVASKHALLVLDLDNFKNINDTLGHDFGDLILQQFTHALRLNLRKEDYIARMGGDEFCIFLNNVDANSVIKTCERILSCKEMAYFKNYGITVSIGVCIGSRARSFDEIYIKADEAMYMIKQTQKDGYQIIDID